MIRSLDQLLRPCSDHAKGHEFMDSTTDEKSVKDPEVVLEGKDLEGLVNEARLATTYDVMLPLSITARKASIWR